MWNVVAGRDRGVGVGSGSGCATVVKVKPVKEVSGRPTFLRADAMLLVMAGS